MATPITHRRRILLLGATGTIGRAVARELAQRGDDLVCVLRRGADSRDARDAVRNARLPDTATLRFADVRDAAALASEGFRDERFDAVVSCLASRTGVPADAWAIDHQANLHALALAQSLGAGHFVLLSAICVQKPRLAFQHAKLAFEQALVGSGMRHSIVRPTAFFKSLSGQIERVQRGKPFLVFGDGTLTACKPISDADLAAYVVDCLDDERRWNRILPIGGPGNAITPREQGERLFALLGRPPRFKQVPPAMLHTIAQVLGAAGSLIPALATKAELARIGHYYATESMLLLDPASGRYDADATPSTGSQTLFDYYAAVIRGDASPERREHAVF